MKRLLLWSVLMFSYISFGQQNDIVWQEVNTGSNATISIGATDASLWNSSNPLVNDDLIPSGALVGVFYVDENGDYVCGGADPKGSSAVFTVTARGDDSMTSEKDGFSNGESFVFFLRICDSGDCWTDTNGDGLVDSGEVASGTDYISMDSEMVDPSASILIDSNNYATNATCALNSATFIEYTNGTSQEGVCEDDDDALNFPNFTCAMAVASFDCDEPWQFATDPTSTIGDLCPESCNPIEDNDAALNFPNFTCAMAVASFDCNEPWQFATDPTSTIGDICQLSCGASNPYCQTSVSGCTDPTAFNYNSEADTDDGSCYNLDFTTLNTGSNMTVQIGVSAVTLNGSAGIIPNGSFLGAFYNNDDGQLACGGVSEWTGDQLAMALWADDNLTDEKDGFSNSEEITWVLSINGQFFEAITSSMNDGSPAMNDGVAAPFSPTFSGDGFGQLLLAQFEGILESGCTDLTAFNYNSSAIIDDGSCYNLDFTTLNTGSNMTVQVGITAVTLNGLVGTIPNGSFLGAFYTNDEGQLACGGVSEWTGGQLAIALWADDNLTDEKDGFSSGEGITWVLSINGQVFEATTSLMNDGSPEMNDGVAAPFSPTFSGDGFGQLKLAQFEGEINSVFGCTDSDADNYNPNATDDDGTCIISGCTNSLACNYNTSANSDNDSCLEPTGCDSCSGETDGTGTLINNDADGDDVCDADEILGCQDIAACNYHSLATNSGSCVFASGCDTCSGETDGTGIIVDNDADDDNVCDADEVLGCEDIQAVNYNSNATEDDNSCCYIAGCTDNGTTNDLDGDGLPAFNYDPAANVCFDDGTCVPYIFGCTLSSACNYNSNVNVPNNAICLFASGCDTCSGETDGSGTVVDGDTDDDGICNNFDTCDGDLDICGVCSGDGTTCLDCCGVPNGDGTTCDGDCGVCNDNTSCLDDCGVINGDNSICSDCCGVPNGDGTTCDGDCGVCNDDTSCLDDCGVPNGDNSTCLDCCGVLNGDGTTCDGDCGACNDDTSCLDDCGVPNGDNSICLDCCGVPNGDGTTCDGDCGACNDDTSCLDDCGVPNGDNSTCLDCCGVPNGDGTTCDGDCGVCNDDTSCLDDCGVPNGDNSTCLDCCGVPNGDGTTCDGDCGVCNDDTSCLDDCGVPNGNNNCIGCSDSNACNYDSNVTIEDNSCVYPQVGFNCDGTTLDTPWGNNNNWCEGNLFVQHTIGFNVNNFTNGDFIGLFFTDTNGDLVFHSGVEYNGNNFAISACPDDESTDEKDGFDIGENFVFQIWPANGDCAYEINVEYSVEDDLGVFATAAISQVNSYSGSPFDVIADVISVSCNGANDGFVNLSYIGGTPPYTPTGSLTNLSPADYNIIITDDSGCESAIEFTITEPDELSVSVLSETDPQCYGETGSAILDISGGTGEYTFSEDLTSLSVGNYDVIVTDENNCSASIQVSISQPDELLVSVLSETDPQCYGETGSAILDISGGTGEYTVSEDITSLTVGNYDVVVTDENACSASIQVSISQPDELLVSVVSETDVLCYGETGSAILDISGGTGEYTVSEDLTSLYAGNYDVIVTDENNCSSSVQITIDQPNQPLSLVNSIVENVSCNGGSNGSLDITIAGGTSPYSFDWTKDGVYLAPAEDLVQLGVGSYSVTVTDGNGCSLIEFFDIDQPDALSLTSFETTAGEYSDCSSGSITINISGGTGDYTYLWSNGSVSSNLTGLCGGTYTVDVTDSNGCVIQETFELDYLAPDGWDITITDDIHTIDIPLDAVLLIDDVALSPGDYLGVFYSNLDGSESCGGYVMFDNDVLQLLVYGSSDGSLGFSVGEQFSWKVWDIETEITTNGFAIYDDTYPDLDTFVIGGSSGISNAIYVTYQTIPLNENPLSDWDMISTYINSSQSVESIFSTVLNELIIVKDALGYVYWPSIPVIDLTELNNVDAYAVKTFGPNNLVIYGEFMQPEDFTFNLSGWNYISYPRYYPEDVEVALANLDGNIKLVKDDSGNIYWPDLDINTMNQMEAGEGYAVKVIENQEFSYDSNSSSTQWAYIGLESAERLGLNLPVYYNAVHQTTNNMTIGLPMSSWVDFDIQEGDELAVYDSQNNLVGVKVLDYENNAITIWGDDVSSSDKEGMVEGEVFSMELWQSSSNKVFDIDFIWEEGSDMFSINGINISSEIIVQDKVENHISSLVCFPNPSSGDFDVEFYLNKDDNVSFLVFNTLGEIVFSIDKQLCLSGYNKMPFSLSQLRQGVYYLEIQSTLDFKNIILDLTK